MFPLWKFHIYKKYETPIWCFLKAFMVCILPLWCIMQCILPSITVVCTIILLLPSIAALLRGDSTGLWISFWQVQKLHKKVNPTIFKYVTLRGVIEGIFEDSNHVRLNQTEGQLPVFVKKNHLKISKPPRMPFPKIIELCNFVYVLDPSDRYLQFTVL